MIKKLVIIDYTNKQLEEYKNQLKTIFEDSLYVETLSSSEIISGNHDALENADLMIFPSYSMFYELKNLIPSDIETSIFERTITRKTYDTMQKYIGRDHVYLIDETETMASEMRDVINKTGGNRFDLIPCSVENAVFVRDGLLLNLGHDIDNKYCEIINVDNTMMSVLSLIEVGVTLSEVTHLMEKNIQNAYKGTISSNRGFRFILNEANKLTSRSESFFDYIEEGYIILNTENEVEEYNYKAENILRPITDNMNEFDVESLFSIETREKVFKQKRKVMNELISIDGKIVVMQIYPTIKSEKFYGTLVIIREFNEVEERQHEIRKKIVGKGHRAKYYFNDIIGESTGIKSCIETAKKMALSNSSILLEGETGTGKELFAQAIHNYSYRNDYQFVAVNCGALPSSILESELFGYEEGAFTGAKKGGKLGLFELAHKGTIFLDEIGEMPIELQTKLLRVLQEKEVMRLGSDRIISVDIRVLAATNENLFELLKLKRFREDLYYRLKVLPLKIPPLRSRKSDILVLFRYFIDQYKGKVVLSESAKEELINYEWKGNIRELRNIAEFCVNIGKTVIENDDLPLQKNEDWHSGNAASARSDADEQDLTKLDNTAGMEREEYYFVLGILYRCYLEKIRIGRRRICSEAMNQMIPITEQKARRILNDLEMLGLVSINIGRKGSEITPRGIRLVRVINGIKGL